MTKQNLKNLKEKSNSVDPSHSHLSASNCFPFPAFVSCGFFPPISLVMKIYGVEIK
jgi:hypothetical protein